MIEIHQKEWVERAQRYRDPKFKDLTFKQELFDASWRATMDTVVNNFQLRGNEHVFDAGFGWGRIALGLKQRFPAMKIDGIELTEDLTVKAHELLKEYNVTEGVSLQQGDILTHEYPSNTYDAVFSIRVFHYIVNRVQAFEKLYASLKTGGKLLVAVPNRYCPVRWFTYHHPLPSIFSFRDEMAKVGFKNLKVGSYGFLPSQQKRFAYDSKFYALERFFQNVPPFNLMGGLIYVAGEK